VLLRPPSTGQAGISLTDVDVAAAAAATLRDVCKAWRTALAESEAAVTSSSTSASSTSASDAAMLSTPSPGPRTSTGTNQTLGSLRPEAAGLLLLCSPSAAVRAAAVEMLGEVAALGAALRRAGGAVLGGAGVAAGAGMGAAADSPGTPNAGGSVAAAAARSMSAIVEACAGDMMWSALGGEGGDAPGSTGGKAVQAVMF
jgi:hypothetical protein